MNEMIKAERDKICSRKQTRILFIAGIILIIAYFFFFQFNYQSVFYNYDLGKMESVSGFSVIEQRKEIAAMFEGELTQGVLLDMQQKINEVLQKEEQLKEDMYEKYGPIDIPTEVLIQYSKEIDKS